MNYEATNQRTVGEPFTFGVKKIPIYITLDEMFSVAVPAVLIFFVSLVLGVKPHFSLPSLLIAVVLIFGFLSSQRKGRPSSYLWDLGHPWGFSSMPGVLPHETRYVCWSGFIPRGRGLINPATAIDAWTPAHEWRPPGGLGGSLPAAADAGKWQHISLTAWYGEPGGHRGSAT